MQIWRALRDSDGVAEATSATLTAWRSGANCSGRLIHLAIPGTGTSSTRSCASRQAGCPRYAPVAWWARAGPLAWKSSARTRDASIMWGGMTVAPPSAPA